jgi:hypothetical protein
MLARLQIGLIKRWCAIAASTCAKYEAAAPVGISCRNSAKRKAFASSNSLNGVKLIGSVRRLSHAIAWELCSSLA